MADETQKITYEVVIDADKATATGNKNIHIDMTQFKLSKLQNDEFSRLISKRNEIEFAIGNMVKFIVDANGDTIDANAKWKYDNGFLSVDIVPHSKTVKQKLKK